MGEDKLDKLVDEAVEEAEDVLNDADLTHEDYAEAALAISDEFRDLAKLHQDVEDGAEGEEDGGEDDEGQEAEEGEEDAASSENAE
jgi:hypothetical protein